ncbi:MAG: hypothetical protein AB8G22_11475 [Saprospiraceae bacterium]
MKIQYYFLFAFAFLSACQSAESNQSEQVATKEVVTEKVTATDLSQYSTAFINELKSAKDIKSAVLHGDKMILNGREAVKFPTSPKLNEATSLQATRDDLTIKLDMKRVNYTAVDYELQLITAGQETLLEKGTAELNPYFFLGSESDMDEKTGVSYLSTEYAANRDSCYTYLRIGNMADDPAQPLSVKVAKNCNGAIRNIDLDNFPALR